MKKDYLKKQSVHAKKLNEYDEPPHVCETSLISVNDQHGKDHYCAPIFDVTMRAVPSRLKDGSLTEPGDPRCTVELELPVVFPRELKAPLNVHFYYTTDPTCKSAIDWSSIGHFRLDMSLKCVYVEQTGRSTIFRGLKAHYNYHRTVPER